jgi:hypothetical protein
MSRRSGRKASVSRSRYAAIGYVVTKVGVPMMRRAAKKRAKAAAKSAAVAPARAARRHPAKAGAALGALLGAGAWLFMRRHDEDDLDA